VGVAENAWAHLQEAVEALVAAGNAVVPPGFHPTQGGWVCEMTGPLDPDVATSFVNADSALAYDQDELFCRHCWTVIIGTDAQARSQTAYQDARRPNETPG
jgi:hypothetical protein